MKSKYPIRHLGELVEVKGGKRLPKGEEYSSTPTEHPYLRVCDFSGGSIDESDLRYLKKTTQSKISRYVISSNDVYISIAGTIGLAGTIPHHLSGANLTENAAKLVVKDKNVLDKTYLTWYLNTMGQSEIEKQIKATSQPKLALFRIEEIPILLPDLEEQRRIAAILDCADAVRRKRQRAIALTEELLRSAFLEMFGDPVTNPKGWEVKTIEAITTNEKGSIKRGPFGGALKKDIFTQTGFLVYEQYHALNNDFSFGRYYIDKDKFDEMKGFAVKPGDIIISCSGVYLGKLAIVPEGAQPGIINQALLKITLNQTKMNNHFFRYHFSHESFRAKFFAANRGSGVPNFPPISEFKKFPFIVPPIEKQNKFSTRLQQIQALQAKAHGSFKESDTFFNSLLQRAFRGEL